MGKPTPDFMRNRHPAKKMTSDPEFKNERTVSVKEDGRVVIAPQKFKIRTLPIAVGIPCDEIVFTKFFRNYQSLTIMPWDDILGSNSTYLPEARNAIHDGFLKDSHCEYLFMLDSDVCPPPNVIDRLLAHHLPMVGGWYRKKNDGTPVVYDYVDEIDGVMRWSNRKTPGTGLERVDGAGAGCWLMRRDVAEALGESPYDMRRGGEDLDLCLKLHKAGFDTWIDWSIGCAHTGVMYV